MSNDPSPEDSMLAISRTKQIMQEFKNNSNVGQYIVEAKEVHTKILKANSEKYGEA
jgi:hypothetical protein